MSGFIPNAWKVSIVNGFRVFELNLLKDQRASIIVSIPPENRFAEQKIGVNTYRANSIVKGAITFRSTSSPDFIRVRGEDTEASRLTMEDTYHLVGTAEDSLFYCVQSVDSAKLYIPRQIPLEPGEEAAIEYRTKERNVFVLQGRVMCDGNEHTAFKHLQLGQPKEYVFKNESPEQTYLLYFYEASVEEVRLQYGEVPAYQLDQVEILRG